MYTPTHTDKQKVRRIIGFTISAIVCSRAEKPTFHSQNRGLTTYADFFLSFIGRFVYRGLTERRSDNYQNLTHCFLHQTRTMHVQKLYAQHTRRTSEDKRLKLGVQKPKLLVKFEWGHITPASNIRGVEISFKNFANSKKKIYALT